MNREGIALFVHILGVVTLFGGLFLFQFGGRQLRGATSWQEARSWIALLQQVPGMFISGSFFVLASGLYLANMEWGFTTPWVVVGIVTVVSFALVGILMPRPSLAGLARMTRERSGQIPDAMRVVFTAPSLWCPIFAMNGAVLGVLWLMTNKPGWAISIGVPLALAAVGAVAGRALHGRGMAGAHSASPAMCGGLARDRTRR